jgi:ATP/maltotriose-dependent transcriptional regulator MalT
MDYAMAIGDPTNSAYLLMRKANIASDLGSPVRALGLTAAALRDAGPISPRVRALVLGQQARAYAILGNADQCARSIDAATQSISEPGANADDVAEYCNPGYIAVQAATCSLDLNRPDEAVPVFEDALRGLPLTMRRDRGLCLTRLATAHAVRGDREEACNAGRQAITTVRSATSARALKELSRLREHLAPWRRDEEVSGLSHAIKGLTSAA